MRGNKVVGSRISKTLRWESAERASQCISHGAECVVGGEQELNLEG